MRKGIIKPLIVASIMSQAIAINAYAVSPGLYLGLMAGPASNGGSTQQAQVEGLPITTPVTPQSSQFGTRLYMGYKASEYFGVEGGFTYFSAINYDSKGVPTCTGGTTVRVRDLDLVGRISYPINNFELYAKLGVAGVYQGSSGDLNPVSSTSTTDCGSSQSSTRAKPTYSLGVAYNLTQNWVTDLSWNRVQTGGFASKMDFIALGIAYHFVDRYCGQFLCDND